MLNKARVLIPIIIISHFLAGCAKSEQLTYQVLIEKAAFLVEDTVDQAIPNMIIVASSEEIADPVPGVHYPEAVAKKLQEVDFEQDFVVFYLVGQIPANGRVSEIMRSKSDIHIRLINFSAGPGNYLRKGYTLPYTMLAIDKAGTNWDDDFHIILEVKDGIRLNEITHTIP